MGRVLLLSIRPRFSESILNGTKTVKLRRTRPRVTTGDTVLIYASAPVKAIVGGFAVGGVVEASPAGLWQKVGNTADIAWPEYERYFAGAAVGYGITVVDPWRLPRPVGLDVLRSRFPSLWPPQSYVYLWTGDSLLDLLPRPGAGPEVS